jgi:hypothetical protein
MCPGMNARLMREGVGLSEEDFSEFERLQTKR